MRSSVVSTPYIAVVTAAGKGERMGGPKALLAVRWGEGPGELPLAIAHARAHLDYGCEQVIVVVRSDVAHRLSGFAQRGLELVVSDAPDTDGPAGSIRKAIALSDPPPDAWLMIEPVDMPPSSAAIRRELLGRVLEAPLPAAVRPTYEGKRGHPVLVRRADLEGLISGQHPTLRDVLHALEASPPAGTVGVVDVPVEDRRAVTTFEVPADISGFYGHDVRFFAEDESTFG